MKLKAIRQHSNEMGHHKVDDTYNVSEQRAAQLLKVRPAIVQPVGGAQKKKKADDSAETKMTAPEENKQS